jgi:hypothetical protein
VTSLDDNQGKNASNLPRDAALSNPSPAFVEKQNTLIHFSQPDSQFLLGGGSYDGISSKTESVC